MAGHSRTSRAGDRSAKCCRVLSALAGALGVAAAAPAQDTQFPCEFEPQYTFSVDIGSDAEMSDPAFDGDEVFDPGDMYLWLAPVFAAPVNGIYDDTLLFGADPSPDPFGPLGPPNSAPACSGLTGFDLRTAYFDLDGYDRLGVDLRQFIPPDNPVFEPVFVQPSACLHVPFELQLSFDDDTAPIYTLPDGTGVCSIPPRSLSPAGRVYGTTAGRDEVVSVATNLVPGLPPYAAGPISPLFSEEDLHLNLGPDPLPEPEEGLDDDVDALDIEPLQEDPNQEGFCPFQYFSADHEAVSLAVLDPGDIYAPSAFGGAPQAVVDGRIHLGLPDGTDVDAFEFVALPVDETAFVLAVVFSVDDDDPSTPADESGGLNPGWVYVSLFDGQFNVFFEEPFGDDVDAIAVYCSLDEPTGACCLPDGVCIDGVTLNDCLQQNGTYQGDGTVCTAVDCVPQTEACCFPNGSCADLTPAACAANGGNPQGFGTSCATVNCPQPPREACCLPNGSCIELTASDCQSQGGVPQGAGTLCSTVSCPLPTEACCFPNGGCADLVAADCVAQGGTPQGANTTCATTQCPQPPTEACCFPGGCADLLPADCFAVGGAPQGPGTSCATTNCVIGACCFACRTTPNPPCPDPGNAVSAPCQQLDQQLCDALNGVFLGAGVPCSDPTGAPNCRCPGDVNGDGATDVSDFFILGGSFGSGGPACLGRPQGDLNCDGVVDVSDFFILASDFGCQ